MNNIPTIYITEPSQLILCSEFCRHLGSEILVVFHGRRRLMMPCRTLLEKEDLREQIKDSLEARSFSGDLPFEFFLHMEPDRGTEV